MILIHHLTPAPYFMIAETSDVGGGDRRGGLAIESVGQGTKPLLSCPCHAGKSSGGGAARAPTEGQRSWGDSGDAELQE